MAKVITFSTSFPSTHPKKGEPTYFPEKIELSLHDLVNHTDRPYLLGKFLPPKHHTIRRGNRWKVGDKFSPRIWTGKPYKSKQKAIAPDIEVKKIYDFEMKPKLWFDECEYYINGKRYGGDELVGVAKNDGLDIMDFAIWFAGKNAASSKRKPFKGQIICWNENINY